MSIITSPAMRGQHPHMRKTSRYATIFPESPSIANKTSSIFRRVASYQHPKFTTEIRYNPTISTATPYAPDPTSPPPSFQTRDEALYQEALLRLKKRAHLPITDRYQGYEDGLLAKIKGIALRIFYIVTKAGVKRGLAAYDRHLLSRPKTLAFINYSAKKAADFTVNMIPKNPLLEALGIRDYKAEHKKLHFTNTWHKNGLPSYQFEEDGKTVILDHTVTSSNDRTADTICMMRRIDSEWTGKSIFYTGRPDSTAKAREQATFIFQSEMRKKPSNRQGIVYDERTGEYELVYAVNNLMSPHGVGTMGLTGLMGLNERAAILKEMEALANLGTLTIDGKKVRMRPIYFNQCFNFLQHLGTSSLQQEINRMGYEQLLTLARAATGKTASFSAAIRHLTNPKNLLPEEEFFYRDLICKELNLPTVIHCKSSTDRTKLAGGISMATAQWLNCQKELSIDDPHTVLTDKTYQELFTSNIMSGHQVSRYSRSAEGIVRGGRQFSQLIGYQWGKNGMGKNEIALRLLPERYKKKGKRPLHIRVALFALTKLYAARRSSALERKIRNLKRAHPKKDFDHDSPYIKKHLLVKPSGMKMYYPPGSTHPRSSA